MTYREHRELELRQQREAEEQRRTKEKAQEAASERDVASLIKHRIAANKKSASGTISANSANQEDSELYLQWYRQARLCNDTSSLLNNDFASSFWVISEGGSKYNNDPLKPQCTQHKSIVYCHWDHYYSLFSWRYRRRR